MDPVSFLFLIGSLISAGISLVDDIQQDAQEARENNQLISTGKVKQVLDTAIAQASSKTQGKLESVLNKISRLEFIQSSPTIKDIIDKARKRLENKEQSLRDDMTQLEGIAIQNQYAYDRANLDVNKKNVAQKLKDYQEETRNQNEKIQEIEQRI